MDQGRIRHDSQTNGVLQIMNNAILKSNITMHEIYNEQQRNNVFGLVLEVL